MTKLSLFAAFLRDRRMQLDPVSLGFGSRRRRTPGLRREEVAERASISTVWYSWLEQGRGGAPSADVVERLAHALVLTDAEREHLFLLALGRPPEPRVRSAGVTPRLQKVLDDMTTCPALVRTPRWDVLAWNVASTRVMTDWGSLPVSERNLLRRVFLDDHSRATNPEWRRTARFAVSVFRGDAARAGLSVAGFVEQLSGESQEFATMWREADVRGLDDGDRRLNHPEVGEITFGICSFAVAGRPDLVMVVHTPATETDVARVAALTRAVRE